MALAGIGGQGQDKQSADRTGHGRRVWRWCEYKGVNEGNTLLQCTTVTHHTHLQGPKGEESTGETNLYRNTIGAGP